MYWSYWQHAAAHCLFVGSRCGSDQRDWRPTKRELGFACHLTASVRMRSTSNIHLVTLNSLLSWWANCSSTAYRIARTDSAHGSSHVVGINSTTTSTNREEQSILLVRLKKMCDVKHDFQWQANAQGLRRFLLFSTTATKHTSVFGVLRLNNRVFYPTRTRWNDVKADIHSYENKWRNVI